MNIACTACPARYGVADEKITGKRVRITCKRCGTVLVIDGTVSPAQVTASTSIAPAPPPRAASNVPPPRAASSVPPPPATPPTEPFLVAFPDEHQERADVAQIVRLYRAGRLGNDSLVWREGMDNWQSPWDVEEIASAFRRMGYARPSPLPFGGVPAQVSRDTAQRATQQRGRTQRLASVDDDETTSVVDSSPVAAERPQYRRPAAEPASSPVNEDDEVPTHVARAGARSSHPPTTTARATARSDRPYQRAGERPERASPQQRASERPAQRSDRPYQRSSERPYQRQQSDRAQRTSTRPAATHDRSEAARRRESTRPAHSPTAERFARQAYAGSEEDEEARQRVAAVESQGLMDATDDGQRLTGQRNETSVLFSLDSLLKPEQPAARAPQHAPPRYDESLLVDANPGLPTGGGFVPGLAAPDFTAPVTAPPPQFAPAPATVEPVVYPREDGSRKWMMMTAAVVVLSVFGFAWVSGALNPVLSKVGLGPAPSAAPAPAPARPAEPTPSAAAPTPSAAPEPPAPSASAEPAASASAIPTTTAVSRAPAAPAQRTPSTRETPSPSPAPRAPATGDSQPEPTAESAPAPAPAPAAGGGDFDASAAKTALTAAAGNASSCKEAGGPTGNGRVSITFAPSGRPTSVAVTGDLAGTTVGSCVARLFRQTRVPAFSGEPVTVAKGFSVE